MHITSADAAIATNLVQTWISGQLRGTGHDPGDADLHVCARALESDRYIRRTYRCLRISEIAIVESLDRALSADHDCDQRHRIRISQRSHPAFAHRRCDFA